MASVDSTTDREARLVASNALSATDTTKGEAE